MKEKLPSKIAKLVVPALLGVAGGYLGSRLGESTPPPTPEPAGFRQEMMEWDDRQLLLAQKVQLIEKWAQGTERWRKDADKRLYYLQEGKK